MKVKEAMHQSVEWVSPDTPIAKVAKIMCDQDIGSVPVGDNDRLVGMVTDRDIACRVVGGKMDPSKTTARDVMTKGIIYCRETEELGDAMRLMETRKVRRLPVINDKKRMVGILAMGDLCQGAPRESIGEVMMAVSEHHA